MSTTNDWIATAEEHWGEVWGTGQSEVIRLGLMASRTAATIALARETARLADAQERTAAMAEAQALALCGLTNVLMVIVPPTPEVRADALSRYERLCERLTVLIDDEGGAR